MGKHNLEEYSSKGKLSFQQFLHFHTSMLFLSHSSTGYSFQKQGRILSESKGFFNLYYGKQVKNSKIKAILRQ